GLHQPQPESAQIEVDVALWITTDRGDVVQATGLKRHGSSSCGGGTSNATEINSFEEDIFLKDCAYTEIRVHGTRRRARRRSGRHLVGPCDRGLSRHPEPAADRDRQAFRTRPRFLRRIATTGAITRTPHAHDPSRP